MELAVFSPRELRIALGTLRAIDARPSAAHDHFLQVLARLHGQRIDPRLLPRATPADAAAVIRDPHRRKRLVQLAMVMTMVDGRVEQAEADAVAVLAQALQVDERAVDTLGKVAADHRMQARMDITRRSIGRFIVQVWRTERWSGIRRLLRLLWRRGEDAATAARYATLEHMPAGTFGRALWDFWRTRGFHLPGEPRSMPERMVFHDIGHVLSGYDTDPQGEIQQAAFQSGFMRHDGFAFLFFGIMQFHLGLRVTPVAQPEVGNFDVDKVMTALARGAACRVDVSDNWDYWPYLPRPLSEVRAALGVPPLSPVS